MNGLKMPCPSLTELAPGSRYDLILVNHTTCAAQALHWKLQGPKVYTSHGPAHPLEKPGVGCDHYVGVSEEVRQAMAEQQVCTGCGAIQVPRCLDVIRQPLDRAKFKPGGVYERQVLVMPKRQEGVEAAAAVCQELGLPFDIVHYKLNPIDEMWKVLPRYRVVITAGRGAVEAMACGCQVLLYNGHNAFDGWATAETLPQLCQTNYSGRSFNYSATQDNLKRALADIPEETLRPWVEEHHDAGAIAERYLAYAAKVSS